MPRFPLEIIEAPDQARSGRSRLWHGRDLGEVAEGPAAASLVLSKQPTGSAPRNALVWLFANPGSADIGTDEDHVILHCFRKHDTYSEQIRPTSFVKHRCMQFRLLIFFIISSPSPVKAHSGFASPAAQSRKISQRQALLTEHLRRASPADRRGSSGHRRSACRMNSQSAARGFGVTPG